MEFIQDMRSILNYDWKVIKETILEGYPSIKRRIEEDSTSITFYNDTYSFGNIERRRLDKAATARANYTIIEKIKHAIFGENKIKIYDEEPSYMLFELEIQIRELLARKYNHMEIWFIFHQPLSGSYVIFTNNSNPHISIPRHIYIESHRQIIHEIENGPQNQMFVP